MLWERDPFTELWAQSLPKMAPHTLCATQTAETVTVSCCSCPVPACSLALTHPHAVTVGWHCCRGTCVLANPP